MEPTVTQTHLPGDSFPVGTTEVVYTFMDMAVNIAMCSFSITGNNLCICYSYTFGLKKFMGQHEVDSNLIKMHLPSYNWLYIFF